MQLVDSPRVSGFNYSFSELGNSMLSSFVKKISSHDLSSLKGL
jgi:hypothetical protein